MKKTYNLSTTDLAKQDISEAAKWYENKSKGLGKRFLKDVRKQSTRIKADPKSLQIRYDKIRISFLENFPFGVHYFLDGNQIIIISVYGMAQDSDDWKQTR